MAKRRVVYVAFPGPTPDERPVGALRFADPSTAEFPRHIHTFNEPASKNFGSQKGVRSVTGDLVPWPSHHGGVNLWKEMNRKRGTVSESEEE